MKFVCKKCGIDTCFLEPKMRSNLPKYCPWGFDEEWKEIKEDEEPKTTHAETKEPMSKSGIADVFHNDKRGKILLNALDIINGDRQDKYGKPEDSFALIAEYWTAFLKSKDLIPSKGSYENLKITAKEAAEMMMLFKIARMSGQKPNLDNYLDLVGYAGIASDMIEED